MSRATVIIDGETKLDEDLSQWQQRPPAFLADLALHKARNTKPGAHLQATLAALVDALTQAKPVTIDVCTDALGWSMTVTHDVHPHARDGIHAEEETAG
jgi:hypothetical protein